MSQVPILEIAPPKPERVTLAVAELDARPRGASNNLRNTLRSVSQLDPIIVETQADGSYRIKDGNRRVLALRAIGKEFVEADAYPPLTEPEWALILLGRHNRAANPVEEAMQCGLLATRLSAEGISANVGLPVQVVRSRLQLFEGLPADVLELVGTKVLSLGVAERVSRLRGAYHDTAIRRVRLKAAQDEAFKASDLREITVARAGALGAQLMAGAHSMPALINPAETVAAEVRGLCASRGVSLADLLAHLGAEDDGPRIARAGAA